MRVLVVGGETLDPNILRDSLLSDGNEVIEALNRGDALRSLEHLEVDLLILDGDLPGLTGIDFLAHIRSNGNTIPTILVSDVDSESDIVFGLELGADIYLVKPFSVRVFLARARALHRRARMATRGLVCRKSQTTQRRDSPDFIGPAESRGRLINIQKP